MDKTNEQKPTKVKFVPGTSVQGERPKMKKARISKDLHSPFNFDIQMKRR